MITSFLTSDSLTTLPKDACQALGVGPGDELQYEIHDGYVVLRKKPALDDLMERFDPAKHRHDAVFSDTVAGHERL